MKKSLIMLCFLIGMSQLAQAQLDFGIKAGINYNSDSFKAVKGEILQGSSESKTGYHAGIWLRLKLPVIGYYLRPELVYTALKSDVTVTANTTEVRPYDFQKIDIPVLFGKKFLKVAYAHIGPSFQYILNGDLDLKDALGEVVNSENFDTETTGFTVGLQLGAGVELGDVGLDLRWERGFSDTESEIYNTVDNNDPFKFDTRINQIIVGLTYKF